MKITFNLILVFILLNIFNHPAMSGSFYNSRGLGEIKYFANAQAIGMGGTLIAVADHFQINQLNPAGLVFISNTRMSGDFLHEAIWNKTKTENGFTKYTNLNGLSLALPLKEGKLVTSLSIIPTSQFDYEYQSSLMIEEYNYTKIIRASGGLNKISYGLGYAITKNIYSGIYFHYNFGKLEQTWRVDYLSDLFWDTTDRLTRKMWGINWSFGLIIKPTPHLYLGAFYSGKYQLTFKDNIDNSTQKGSLIYYVDSFTLKNKQLNIPELWGIGASYLLREKYRLSADYLYQPWANFQKENKLTQNYQNTYRIGLGFEMLPSTNMLAKYYEKMTYRLGYFFHRLDFQDESGNSVSETGITVGTGFPYYGTFGRIDVALRWGKRGDIASNLVEENIFQIFISITGGEKWFSR